MNKTYALKCIQGHPHFGHWVTINVFADEFVAHDVCKRAQARHEELRERLPKDVRLTGLNPFDPGYDGPWTPTRYFVEVIPVFDNPEADAVGVSEFTIREQNAAITGGADFMSAGAIELNLAGTRVSRECSDSEFNLYEPVPLLKVSRDSSYTLYLTGGLIERRYLDGSRGPTYFPRPLEALSNEEKLKLRAGAQVCRTTRESVLKPGNQFMSPGDYLEYQGKLQWQCDTQAEFKANIAALPGTLPEMLSQLITLFSHWNRQHFSARRLISNEFYAARHASSEATSG